MSTARAVTPLIYPFPHAGKLLALLFVPFAAWFVDQPVSVAQYPLLFGDGPVQHVRESTGGDTFPA